MRTPAVGHMGLLVAPGTAGPLPSSPALLETAAHAWVLFLTCLAWPGHWVVPSRALDIVHSSICVAATAFYRNPFPVLLNGNLLLVL